jgi:hypothetical protein
MSKPRQSHSWARKFSYEDAEVRALSPLAQSGWLYALAVALNAEERSEAGLAQQEVLPERLTPALLAEENGISPAEVSKAIEQARVELFGSAQSYSAIAYRLNRRGRRGRRTCAEPGCEVVLSGLAHGSRRYCPEHGTTRARVARHRRAQPVN